MKASRSQTLSWALLCAIIIPMVAGYTLTLRQGHDWGGDFAMYIHHAANIAEGKPYADTGYIYNPSYPSLGPKAYPPIYPIVLAPVYRIFGLDYSPLKIENVLFLAGAMAVLYLTFRETLPDCARLAVVVVVAANPYLWGYKENVGPEFLFLLLTLLALYSIDRAYRQRPGQPPALRQALLVGALCYLAYGTRSQGLVLVPALLIHDIALCRKPSRFAVAAAAVFAALAGLQGLLVPGTGSYLDQFATVTDWRRVLAGSISACLRGFSFYFDGLGTNRALLLGLAVGILAIVGYVVRARRQLGVYEAFFALYLAGIIAWPAARSSFTCHRLLSAVFPLALLYAAVGVLAFRPLVRGLLIGGASSLLILGILLSYAKFYSRAPSGFIGGVESGDSVALFSFIRQETPENAILVFRKPRPLSLYTGRAASAYHRPKDREELWGYLRSIDADYIIVGQFFDEDRSYLEPFVRRYENRLAKVYDREGYAVYRIVSFTAP